MLVFMKDTMTLTKLERTALMQRAKSRTGRAEDARRARVILLLSEGRTWETVCAQVGCSRGFVALRRQRFTDERLAGLYSRHRGQAPQRHTPQTEARIPEAARLANRLSGGRPATGRLTGAPVSSPPGWASAICGWLGCGPNTGSSRIGWTAIWPPMIHTLRRRRPISLAST